MLSPCLAGALVTCKGFHESTAGLKSDLNKNLVCSLRYDGFKTRPHEPNKLSLISDLLKTERTLQQYSESVKSVLVSASRVDFNILSISR